MKKTLLLFCLLLSACTRDKTPILPSGDRQVIAYGTSFGLCAGYCRRSLAVEGGIATFVASSWTPELLPAITISDTLPAAEWSAILAAVNWPALKSQPDVIGCPDCADGGAEWLEIIYPTEQKRVTFEYGETIPGQEPLLEKMRALHQRLNEQMPDPGL